jgi:hypothetical protein
LQGEIPDFRDTYETSAFLATQLALGETHATVESQNYPSSSISDQLGAPRLFEVKRNGEILSFAWEPPPAKAPNDTKPKNDQIAGEETGRSVAFGWPCWESKAGIQCGNIQPVDLDELKKQKDLNPKSYILDPKPVEKLFPTFSAEARKNLPLSFGLAAIATLFLWPWAARSKRVELILFTLGLAVAAFICLEWEPLARCLTSNKVCDDGAGEPIALLDGTSLWPTVFLRGLGLILTVYFIWRALRDLHDNLEHIVDVMNLNLHPASLPDQFMFEKQRWYLDGRFSKKRFVLPRRKSMGGLYPSRAILAPHSVGRILDPLHVHGYVFYSLSDVWHACLWSPE